MITKEIGSDIKTFLVIQFTWFHYFLLKKLNSLFTRLHH